MMTNPHCSHKEPEDIATLVFFVKRLSQLLSGQTHYFRLIFRLYLSFSYLFTLILSCTEENENQRLIQKLSCSGLVLLPFQGI